LTPGININLKVLVGQIYQIFVMRQQFKLQEKTVNLFVLKILRQLVKELWQDYRKKS
jgi:hypothetical protein